MAQTASARYVSYLRDNTSASRPNHPGVPLLLSPNLTEAKLLSVREEEGNLVCEAVVCDTEATGSSSSHRRPQQAVFLLAERECACTCFTEVKTSILISKRTRLPCTVYNFQGRFKIETSPACNEAMFIHIHSCGWLFRQRDLIVTVTQGPGFLSGSFCPQQPGTWEFSYTWPKRGPPCCMKEVTSVFLTCSHETTLGC